METKTLTNRIIELLSSLTGVVGVAEVRRSDIEEIKRNEYAYEQSQVVELKNVGIYAVLQRRLLFVLLKDRRFRHPPKPTIYLVEEQNHGPEASDHCIQVENRLYHIVGEEIIGQIPEYDEKTVQFGDGFLLFPQRRIGRTDTPAYFMIPPIDFPELSEKADEWQIKNCMSISPSTVSDDFLRERYSFPTDPEYATILVGCDLV